MQVSAGPLNFTWREDWAVLPDTDSVRANGRTHGVCESRDGRVFVFAQADPAVYVFAADGAPLGAFSSDFPEAHGLTLVEENGVEYLWLTDQASGRVAKVTLDGETVQTIDRPDHPIYAEKRYSPTWACADPNSGRVFVTDGYGSFLIHAYDRAGNYEFSLTGDEGAGAFACPHGIYTDTRGGKAPELYIADRANRRIQVYTMDGQFVRSFGTDVLNHPDGCVATGEYLVVPELFGRIAIFDGKDRFVGYLGENVPVVEAWRNAGWPGAQIEGWPNLAREKVCVEGAFSSPHGAGVGADGSIYVVEWFYPGGRIVKLERQP